MIWKEKILFFILQNKWENNKGEDIMSNVLATIMDYIRQIDICLKEENNSNLLKMMTGQFILKILSEAYFLKLLISIDKRNGLQLEMPKDTYIESLLPFVYAESKLKHKESERISKFSHTNYLFSLNSTEFYS